MYATANLTHSGCAEVVTERRFAAMGTRVHVVVNCTRAHRSGEAGDPHRPSADGLVAEAARRVDELEARWSRFRSTSEVTRLNRAGGRALEVSYDTYLLVQRACQAWHLSDGAFDPTVLEALEISGYDRSFETLSADGPTPCLVGGPTPGCAGIELDDRGLMVRLPAGVGFDPGGIGKGLAADIVAAQVMRGGATGVLVSIGGDVVALGASPEVGGWTVEINEPTICASPLATLSFAEGAVATSVTTRRTWVANGEARHHLIDPRTGQSHTGDVVLATALACEGWLAEITTKAHIGDHVSPALASVPALVVTADGRIEARSGMEDYLS